MEVYKIPIEFAFIVFPFIAFILTIPFLIHQYRKYGAIPLLKSIVFYSMILYLICAYFLVMLPLPSIESVSKMTGPTTQLHLFQFIEDIKVTVDFNINSFNDILTILKSSTVYTVLFNIVLTLPFGVYLRYFFKKKWYHTLIYTFILSLFFELTQLSGLYGIYPRPYRLFDVDDLLINTLGGLIGHAITPILTVLLPTRDELEAKSYKKGQKVTLLRRVMSLIIDIVFLAFLCLIARILFNDTIFEKAYALITISIYYIVIPLFTSGRTLGKKVLRLKIESLEGPSTWYQILFRNILLVYIVIYPYVWISLLTMTEPVERRLWSVLIICQIINFLYYLVTLPKDTHIFLYERLSQTKNISIIDSNFTLLSNEETIEDSVNKETISEKMSEKEIKEKKTHNKQKSKSSK